MSEKSTVKVIPKKLEKSYALVGGLTIELIEPTISDVQNKTNIQMLASMLKSMKGDDTYKDMSFEKKEKTLLELNSVISSAFVSKMDEFLKSDVKVERSDMDVDTVIASLFSDNSLSRTVTFKNEGRELQVVLKSPLTSEVGAMIEDIKAMALYCSSINGFEKNSMSDGEWLALIKKLPYLLAKNILSEYGEMFSKAQKYILNEEVFEKGVKNF